jgi:predicted Zn-dependent protease
MFRKTITVFLGALFLITLFGCQQKVIFTDRDQNLLLPESQMVSLGEESYAQQLSTAVVITKGVQAAMVNRVAARLIPVVEHDLQKLGKTDQLSQLHWQFTLISDDKTLNAYCLPGGKVAVYSGILKLASNDDELAVVLSHEIAHALAEHGNERMSEQLVLQFGGMVLDKVFEKNPAQTRQVFQSVYGIGTSVGVALPHSREQESEADKIGLILLIQAGYNPDSAISFWDKMKASGGSKPPEFLSTHPADERRAADLKAFIPQANTYKTF